MELAIAGAAARGEYDASPGQGDHQGVSPVTPVDMTDKGTGTLDRDGTKTGGFFAGLFGK